jgi:hypothetical protein
MDHEGIDLIAKRRHCAGDVYLQPKAIGSHCPDGPILLNVKARYLPKTQRIWVVVIGWVEAANDFGPRSG